MSIDLHSPEGILRVARARASFVWPYLSHAIFSLIPVKVDGLNTFAVDAHWRMYWDPKAVERWGLETTTTALRHEVEHLLRLHFDRAKSCGISDGDWKAWLAAIDCELNDGLLREVIEHRKSKETSNNKKDEALVDFGKDWLLPKMFDMPDDLLAEEYLQQLRKLISKCQGMGDCGSGAHGQARPWELPSPHSKNKDVPGLSRAEGDYIRTKTAEAIRNESSKNIGNVPGEWLRWAEEVLEPPKVDWHNELRGVVRCAVHEVAGMMDYSYSRPSRRQDAYGDVIVPAMRKPVPRVAVVGDTSGSMSDKDIANIPAEIEGICMALNASVLFLSVDAAVHTQSEVMSGRSAASKLKGGGGTDMRVGITAALESKPRPDVLVVITDSQTPWPAEAPPRCRVIVVRVGAYKGDAPAWARVVDVD